MKRRLSVAISTIGDPKVVFMDEPTTGMDPLNRRHVWAFIEEFKKNRIVILTTHSMEEADILGDEIAIMAVAKLSAIGTPIHLKNKFGSGYHLTVVCDESVTATVKADLTARVPDLRVEDDSAGALMFNIPNSNRDRIPDLVRHLESGQDGAGTAAGQIGTGPRGAHALRVLGHACGAGGGGGVEPGRVEMDTHPHGRYIERVLHGGGVHACVLVWGVCVCMGAARGTRRPQRWCANGVCRRRPSKMCS